MNSKIGNLTKPAPQIWSNQVSKSADVRLRQKPTFDLIFVCFILLNLVFATCLNAQLIELPRFSLLKDYVDESTLLLVDIDDTLLIPPQMLGCDEWFQHRLKMYQESGLPARDALEKSLAEWEAIRHITKMEVVEEEAVLTLQDLQSKGRVIMGFTTQGLSLTTRTLQQLAGHRIHLNVTAPLKKDHYLLVNEHGVLFRKGVLFTSGTHKGSAFFQWCDEIGYTPKRVVFINDKASHLKEIEEMAEKRGVEFIGLRYAYSDARKKQFRAEVADFQFVNSSFHRILSDAEAITRIATLPQF